MRCGRPRVSSSDMLTGALQRKKRPVSSTCIRMIPSPEWNLSNCENQKYQEFVEKRQIKGQQSTVPHKDFRHEKTLVKKSQHDLRKFVEEIVDIAPMLLDVSQGDSDHPKQDKDNDDTQKVERQHADAV